MRYTIRAGDTLGAIAADHGLTLDQLLDANPAMRAAPNRIQVGQVVELPDAAPAAPTAQPAAPPAAPPASSAPSPGLALGSLSTRYETGGRGSTTISTGAGDAGGVSYGSYQMTSVNGGTVARFVGQADFPWRDRFAGLTPGSKPFSDAWLDLATRFPTEFRSAEHEFIKRTHFDVLCAKVKAEDAVDITGCSHALQDTVWSTAVQHGGGTDVIHAAFNAMRAAGTFSPGTAGFERAAIVAIYAERGRKNADGTLARFSRNSAQVQSGVAKRFVSECADALRML